MRLVAAQCRWESEALRISRRDEGVMWWQLWGRLMVGHGVHAVTTVLATVVVVSPAPGWAGWMVGLVVGGVVVAGVTGGLDRALAKAVYRARPMTSGELEGLWAAIAPLCAVRLGPPTVRYEVTRHRLPVPAVPVGSGVVVISEDHVVAPGLNRRVDPGWVRDVVGVAAGQTRLSVARGVSVVRVLAVPSQVVCRVLEGLPFAGVVASAWSARIVTGPVLVAIIVFQMHLYAQAVLAAAWLGMTYLQPWAERTWATTFRVAGSELFRARMLVPQDR